MDKQADPALRSSYIVSVVLLYVAITVSRSIGQRLGEKCVALR